MPSEAEIQALLATGDWESPEWEAPGLTNFWWEVLYDCLPANCKRYLHQVRKERLPTRPSYRDAPADVYFRSPIPGVRVRELVGLAMQVQAEIVNQRAAAVEAAEGELPMKWWIPSQDIQRETAREAMRYVLALSLEGYEAEIAMRALARAMAE